MARSESRNLTMTDPTCKACTEQKEKYMKKKEITVLPSPKCGSTFLAKGKPFGIATPRLVAWFGSLHGVVCTACGHYKPTVIAWNREWRKKNAQ